MGISLCMIVKNEEDWVDAAVESVRSIVDEVIIVDTGSTDSTPAHARALGARLIESPWTDSFAEARNVSLDAATQPWILVLDADERIATRDLARLRDLTRVGAADGYHVIQRNYVSRSGLFGWTANKDDYEEGARYTGYVDNPLIRLFRNSPQIRFRGAVHEIIDPPSLPKHLKFGSTSVVIHHYGKVRNEEHVLAKQRLYLALGLKKVNQDPGNAKAHFDLGIQYQELGRDEEACACFDLAFDLTRQPTVLVYWAISEKKLRNYHSAAGLLNHAVELGLDSFEVHLELGNVHLAQCEWTAAQAEYAKCLSLNPHNPVPAFNHGLALRKMGDTEGAVNFYTLALRLDPGFREPMMELAVLHLQNNRPDEALRILQDVHDSDANVLSLVGTAHLQKGELDQAQKHLEDALRKNRHLIDARLNLAQVYTRKGDHTRAARYTQSVGTV
jgi:glycosyltransferase involved in cell wall biosynthesis/cytochrome c-type biogenesis protein CcmH/NrfG